MTTKSWYNGYSPKERDAKFIELKRKLADNELPPASGPCALCGDPGDDPAVSAHFEYHDEDYGADFIWSEPALYCLCRNCHRNKLHKRFGNPVAWEDFLVHVRRGGYAREFGSPVVKRELATYRDSIARGEAVSLPQLRPYAREVGTEWFANLRTDEASLTDPSARKR